jgi:hypothetical protein
MTVEATTGGCGCAGGGRKKHGKGHTKKHMKHIKSKTPKINKKGKGKTKAKPKH